MALRTRRTRARPRSWIWLPTKQPHHVTVLVSLALAILAVASTQMHIDTVSKNAFWVLLAAYVVLALGNLVVGL